jgi:hypothetical protein
VWRVYSFRRSTDEKYSILNSRHSENYAERLFRFVESSMTLTKSSLLLPRAAATASLVVLVLLVLVPCAVLFLAISPESASQHLRLSRVPVIYWAAWALVSLWAALDSSKLWRTLGRPVDPLGSYGVWGMLLGALNIGASLLVVLSRTSR